MIIIKDYLSLVIFAFFVSLFFLMLNKPVNATEVTVLYTGDALGEIEPCG